jgi:hypothetical protein
VLDRSEVERFSKAVSEGGVLGDVFVTLGALIATRLVQLLDRIRIWF